MSGMPIRCFQCGAVVGNKWELFWKLTGIDPENGFKVPNDENNPIEKKTSKKYMPIQNAIDELHIEKRCCRQMFLTSIQYTD